MEEQISYIKNWLGVGTINIFGIQFSGKDTVGQNLAKVLDAEFIASGDVVRANAERLKNDTNTDQGFLAPTKEYIELVEEYLIDETPANRALVLSSFGRWIGEEEPVMRTLKRSGHETKIALVLNISENEVWQRWEKIGNERNGGRVDDIDKEKVARRIQEFKEKTLPVIEIYRKMGILIEIDGEQSREKVMNDVIEKLYEFSCVKS